MFDFDYGDDLDLIVETARSFATEELHPRLRDHEAARAVEPEVARAYQEIGLAGLELPESLGGANLGALARVLVNEELAAGDAGASISPHLLFDLPRPTLTARRVLASEAASGAARTTT